MCIGGCNKGKKASGKSSSTRNSTRNAYTPKPAMRGGGFGSPTVKIKFGGKK